MPVIFILFITLLIVFFWDYINDNVAVIGSIATALAFFATAWAAFEARSSAKAALKAVRLTSDTLFEMRKSSFKQWLELLLEKHDEIIKDVYFLLRDDNDIKIKLSLNQVKPVYYTVIKKNILVKYINHIVIILKFIDQDFYISPGSIDNRKKYIDQLRNSINSDVHLIIAIFGLNVTNSGLHNYRELSFLLNKYNFFDNELFFEKINDNVNFLDSYVNKLVDDTFRTDIIRVVEHNIMNYKSKITNPYDDNNNHYPPGLLFSILYSYNNPCKRIITERFSLMGGFIRNEIKSNIANARNEKIKAESELSKLIGYRLVSGNKLKRRSGLYVINTKKDVVNLVEHIIKTSKINTSYISLDDVYFSKDGVPDVLGTNYERIVGKYDLSYHSILLDMENNKEELLCKIFSVVDEIIVYHTDKLKAFSYH